jgi:integrase
VVLKDLYALYTTSQWFAGLSPKTRFTYTHKLGRLVESLGDIESHHLNGDRFSLSCEGKSNNEFNHLFQILSAILTWGSRELGLPKPTILCRRKPHKALPKSTMTKEQAKSLLAYRDKVGHTKAGVIANSMLAMYLTGMRNEELLNAQECDVKDTLIEITWAKGKEKGAMSRAVGLNALSLGVLKWFPKSDGHLVPLNVRTYKSFFKTWSSIRVAVGGCGNLTPHGARHGFATQMLREGYDIYTISKMLGHADIKTTERYLQMNDHEIASRFKGFEI